MLKYYGFFGKNVIEEGSTSKKFVVCYLGDIKKSSVNNAENSECRAVETQTNVCYYITKRRKEFGYD